MGQFGDNQLIRMHLNANEPCIADLFTRSSVLSGKLTQGACVTATQKAQPGRLKVPYQRAARMCSGLVHFH